MRSQGVFEYLLLLMGVILVVLLVINTLISSAKYSTSEINEQMNYAYRAMRTLLNKIIQQLPQ